MTELPINQIICGDWIEKLGPIPDKTYHLVVTSPPYWGHRDYGVDGQLGLEKTPEEHIEKLVAGFREVRRVLRDDGVLFLNYGPKYCDEPTEIMELRPDLTSKEIAYVLRELSDDMKHKDIGGFQEDD
jgi:DNA modification methylase